MTGPRAAAATGRADRSHRERGVPARIARVLAWLVLLVGSLGAPAARAGEKAPALEAGRAYRGIAVLSSSLGDAVPLDEVEAFVQACRIDLVVVDFAWVTFHFPRTDLARVEDLAQRMRRRGVTVAAMYRPRLLRAAEGAGVHLATDAAGAASADHADLCFAWPDSVAWGAQWGERILAGCPSIDHVVLYNLRAPCLCERCRDGAGARHAGEFIDSCRARWAKVRPGVRVGHVGVGLEYAEHVDFLCPFLPVNREEASVPPDAAALAGASEALRAGAPGKPFVPLAKVCWEQATTNTTEDVAAVLRACDARKLGFLLWTYEWLFHPEDGRYDPDALVRALGGDPAALAGFLHPPPAPAQAADGRQWVFFDSREKAPGPTLVLVAASGRETAVAAEADAGLISYLADRNWGRLPSLGVSLGDTNRSLVRFGLRRVGAFRRAELRLSMHLAEVAPRAPFELAVHAVDEGWEEATATWSRAPAFAAEPSATATLAAEAGDVRIDVTALVREWTSGRRPNHGVLLKIAHPVPAGTAPLARTDEGAALVRRAMARWTWAETPDAALARARAEGRPVLAVVVADARGEDPDPHEAILFSTVLSNPAVAGLVAAHFVPVRVALPAWQFVPQPGPGADDPLKALGTTAEAAGAPALVVARPDGRLVASLPSLGTFDHRLVADFLRDALAKAGGPQIPGEGDPADVLARAERSLGGSAAGAARVDRGIALLRLGRFDEAAKALRDAVATAGDRTGEASYWLGAVLQKQGDRGWREVLEKLAGRGADDPWAAKAAMRLAWPQAVSAHEGLVDPSAGPAPATGAGRAALRGIDVLLREQSPDGSWPVANPSGADFQAGISVLAAHALLAWRDDLDGPRKEQADRALRAADAWLDVHVARAPPADLNSFAAAYFVDYLLDRLARKGASREAVAGAIGRLVGGRCPSGAWSYSLAFGRDWRGSERTHSVNTGLAVAVLARAKAAGFAVDEKALAGGVAALLAMRKGPGAYTYMWPGKPNFDTDDASIARAPLCDTALLRVGRASKEDLRRSLDVFLRLRAELRATGRTSTPTWLPPHAYTSYFIHFAWYHAAAALAELGDARSKQDLATLRDELVAWAEPDGAWVDDLQLGKAYGTAAALLTLRVAGARLR